jgi:hypothetical protein
MTPQREQLIGGPAKDIHNARNVMAAEDIPGKGPLDKLQWAIRNGIPKAVTIGGATVALYPEAGFPAELDPARRAQGSQPSTRPAAVQARPSPLVSSPAFDQWWERLRAR